MLGMEGKIHDVGAHGLNRCKLTVPYLTLGIT